jgi:hypothetical protein
LSAQGGATRIQYCIPTVFGRMVTRGEARAVRTPLNETGVGCALSGDRSCGVGHDKIRFLENLFSTMSSFHDISDVYCMASAAAAIVVANYEVRLFPVRP